MIGSLIVAAPTPFSADGGVDLDGVRHNTAKWFRAGVDGVLVLGSTGESIHVTDDEADSIVKAAREATPRDKTLVVGTARPTTAATIGWTSRAASAGADIALVLTPFYYRTEMTREVLSQYYRAVADVSPIPILLYSMPAFTGVTIPPDLTVELSAHPRIFGMKDSSGDMSAIFDEASRSAAGFRILNGSARAVYPALAAGAHGSILAIASVVPELAIAAHRSFAAGDLPSARRAAMKLGTLATRLSPFGLGGLKAAMSLQGYRGGLPRAPLVFDPNNLSAIEAALADVRGAERGEHV